MEESVVTNCKTDDTKHAVCLKIEGSQPFFNKRLIVLKNSPEKLL
jgi:hypothetical protein